MKENYNLNNNNSEVLLVSAQLNTDLRGLGKKIAESFNEMDLSNFGNEITLTGKRSSELLGYVRSNCDVRVFYFPQNYLENGSRIFGKEINLDNYLGFK